MKFLKNIAKYCIIFIVVLLVLLTLLMITMKIPKEAIEENLAKSADFFKNRSVVDRLQAGREYTYLHLYSESVLLNIIYCVDTDDVLSSTMLDRFYESGITDYNKDFISLVENDYEPNTQYLRYWHGSMAIIRPLLVFFSIQEIFMINYILLNILFVILLIILLKKNKKLALIYVISMAMVAFPFVAISLLYSWTFYIMIITSIIAIFIEKKGEKGLYVLFFITGIVTCFLDFLTTEFITLYVPILFVLYLRKEENRSLGFKNNLKFLLKSTLIWLVGYFGMHFAKWGLASIVLNINALEYVTGNLSLRVNGTDSLISKSTMYSKVIPMNFLTLYPIANIKGTARQIRLVITLFVIFVALIDWKNIKNKKESLLMIIIAAWPYVRFLTLANHSYKHFFFTYRAQIITLIALGIFIIENFNYNFWCKKININNIFKPKRKSNEKNLEN